VNRPTLPPSVTHAGAVRLSEYVKSSAFHM
jgi:hypothetical protein